MTRISAYGPMLLTTVLAACASVPAGHPDARVAAQGATDEAGFVSLFDGVSLAGWHVYRQAGQPVTGWQAVDGELVRTDAVGDLISDRQYGDFDLRFEWKISSAGNSGLFYRLTEDETAAYMTGIEYQILDNQRHPDGKHGPDRHAGAVYGMYPAQGAQPAPVGQWNQARIVARGAEVEHWLNGKKVAQYSLWTTQWKARVAQTKFKNWPRYGMARRGHIGLQDHGDDVRYRNIRIKAL